MRQRVQGFHDEIDGVSAIRNVATCFRLNSFAWARAASIASRVHLSVGQVSLGQLANQWLSTVR